MNSKKIGLISLFILALLGLILANYFFKNDKEKESKLEKSFQSKKSSQSFSQKNKIEDSKTNSNLKKSPEHQDHKREKIDQYIISFGKFIDDFEVINPNSLGESLFQEKLTKALQLFPSKSNIQKLSPGEVHTIPVPVSLTGEFLGILKKHLAKNPDLKKSASLFYDQCSRQKDLVTSVKALCLGNLIILKTENGEKIEAARYEKEVVDLAKHLESL